MSEQSVVHLLVLIKVYAVEIAGTAVFLVFIVVETVRAINHLVRGRL
jgi:hypothetical protein